jgi:hypothetical protein
VKQLGDYLVWESNGCTCTLDTNLISSTVYYGLFSVSPGQVEVYCRDESEPTEFTGDNAEWFHNWWMKRLETMEEEDAIGREEARKWREKHAIGGAESIPAKQEGGAHSV